MKDKPQGYAHLTAEIDSLQEQLRLCNVDQFSTAAELAAAVSQRDRLEVALKTIEGHHNENDSWRDIAREALKECGK